MNHYLPLNMGVFCFPFGNGKQCGRPARHVRSSLFARDHITEKCGYSDNKPVVLEGNYYKNKPDYMENNKTHELIVQPQDVPIDWNISIFSEELLEVPLAELHNVPSDEEIMNDIWRIVDTEISNALASIKY